MDIGRESQNDDLLRTITIFSFSSNHQEAVLQSIYSGYNQSTTESVSAYLQNVREVAEDA